MALEKFTWKNGSQVEPAKVIVDGVSYDVTDAQYEGETPLSAANLNQMQDTLLSNVIDDLSDETKIPNVKSINKLIEYSTNETIIGTYLGKKLYRKVIPFGTVANGQTVVKSASELGLSNVDLIVNWNGYAINSSNGFRIPLPYVYKNTQAVTTFFSNNSLRVENYGTQVSLDITVIIEYTKTTD